MIENREKLKIIFNHRFDWYWQIYDEWSKDNIIIVPDNFKNDIESDLDLDALEKCVNKNENVDFIFDFHGDLIDLIKWNKRNIKIPIIILATNSIFRPTPAKRSIFANIWYVEKLASPLMQKFNRENLIYEGMAANPNIFYPKSIQKIYDIGFFGQVYGERGYWLNVIKNYCMKNNYKYYFPKGDGVKFIWDFDEINKFYNQTRINISFAPISPLGRIVNLRTFEICMSGNFQLMQYTPCVEEYFEINKEIVCWKNKKDLLEKITYYLINEEEREKIAKNGYNKAISCHTWTKRLESINSFLKKPKIDIKKYILETNQFINKYKIDRIKKFNTFDSDQCFDKLIKPILKNYKYKIKSDINRISWIRINRTYKYSINNKKINNYFVSFYDKIMMVIRVLPSDSELNIENWNDLKEIIYLTENKDLSFPQFGILTNGSQWIVRDFKNKNWLNYIPNRRELKYWLNLKKYFSMIIIDYILKLLSKFQLGFVKNIIRKIELLIGKKI